MRQMALEQHLLSYADKLSNILDDIDGIDNNSNNIHNSDNKISDGKINDNDNENIYANDDNFQVYKQQFYEQMNELLEDTYKRNMNKMINNSKHFKEIYDIQHKLLLSNNDKKKVSYMMTF